MTNSEAECAASSASSVLLDIKIYSFYIRDMIIYSNYFMVLAV